MKIFMTALFLLASTATFAGTTELNFNEPAPAVDRVDGTWTADIKEVLPLNRVYISNAKLVLDTPLLEQSEFNLGLDELGREFACSHFGYGAVVGVMPTETGAFEGKYSVVIEMKGEQLVFNLKLNKSDSPEYFKTIMCEMK